MFDAATMQATPNTSWLQREVSTSSGAEDALAVDIAAIAYSTFGADHDLDPDRARRPLLGYNQGQRVSPNLLYLRLLLYQDRHGPGAYGPVVWVIARNTQENGEGSKPGTNSRAFSIL